MIITNLSGGLGNQMFQYACGVSMSIATGLKLYIITDMFGTFESDHNGYELKRVFNIETPEFNKFLLRGIIGPFTSVSLRKFVGSKFCPVRPKYFIVDSNGLSQALRDEYKKIYIQGYWQSEKYFSKTIPLIHKTFQFNRNIVNNNKVNYDLIKSSNSVSIHFRRGDYLNNINRHGSHRVLELSYYINSIEYMNKHLPDSTFFAFSDDPEWVRLKILPMFPFVRIIDNNSSTNSYGDMFLMSMCKHNITANSTFSWWAAWLNNNPNKIIVTPKKWFNGTSTPNDLIPDNWVQL